MILITPCTYIHIIHAYTTQLQGGDCHKCRSNRPPFGGMSLWHPRFLQNVKLLTSDFKIFNLL